MRSCFVRFSTICFLMLCGYIPLSAQHRGYRMQLSNGTSGWVALVNDSEKPIEAFHFTGQCGNMIGNDFTYDALDSAGSRMLHPSIDGQAFDQNDVVKPGERMFSMVNLLPQPSGCAWQGDIDAVIFADGTYEGNETTVRGMQARRDGIAAALKYWAQQLHQQAQDNTDADALALEAKDLSHEDFKKTMFPGCHKSPLACEYWRGRQQVDANIESWGKVKNGSAQKRYGSVLHSMERWQTKMDNDPALTKLDEIFPLPADIASSTR